MSGVITKKDFFKILRYFGLKKALYVLVGKESLALNILMK